MEEVLKYSWSLYVFTFLFTKNKKKRQYNCLGIEDHILTTIVEKEG